MSLVDRHTQGDTQVPCCNDGLQIAYVFLLLSLTADECQLLTVGTLVGVEVQAGKSGTLHRSAKKFK